jgi:RNA polymerase sigma factor (sigma-70 family)
VEIQTLFDEAFPPLHRYCVRLTGDPDVAQDVAQEAFVRLVRDQVQGPPPALKSWLFRVANNLIRDRYRVSENRRRLLEAHPVAPAAAPDPERELERAQTVAGVRAALNALSERDRTLLLMREEGFSYQEMADAVGVKSTSVGTLLARAQERFVEVYQPDGAEAEDAGAGKESP